MSSKPSDSQDLKLAPGWTSLSKNASHPPTSSSISSAGPPPSRPSTAARIAYSKAALLGLYDPGTTASIPSTMSEYQGLTSAEPLVPVNIAPEDDADHVSPLTDSPIPIVANPSPPRSRFQSTAAPRPGVEAILRREQAQPPIVAANPSVSSVEVASSSTGSTKKAGHVTSSNRDFWSGSAVLAAAERPNASGTISERRPLALKPRSTVDRASSPNGHATDKPSSAPQSQPYWSRGNSRGGADSNSNWRGGISTGGAKYPGSSLDELGGTGSASSSVATSAQNAPARKSSSDLMSSSNLAHGGGHSSTTRSTFGREGGLFSRNNKEALKPTNTRDLTVLAKGSNRDNNSSSTVSHHERENRDTRQHGNNEAQPKAPVDPAGDTQRIWYYRDPQGNTQGPFTSSQLIEWEKEGYYDSELPVSKSTDGGFKALAIAFGMRKEDPPVAAPPPGFDGTGSMKKESGEVVSPMSMRPSREERNRRGVRTVEDMAEEVEKMRLVNRNKRLGQKGLPDDSDNPPENDKSFFDAHSASSDVPLRDAEQRKPVEEPADDPKTNAPPTRTPQMDESAMGNSAGGDMQKQDLPVKQSRFAALMKQDKSKEVKTAVQLNNSDLNDEVPATRPIPPSHGSAESATNLETGSGLSTGSGQRGTVEVETSSGEQLNAWNSMMMELQHQQHHPGQLHQPPQQFIQQPPQTSSGAMPVAPSEPDLMAIDPAIAHASFSRPNINASSGASPRPSSTEIPSWLSFSPGTEPGNVLNMRDPVLDGRQRLPVQAGIQLPLSQHASSQEQAQLHAQAQVRAQAEAHARAEAYRQAQVQAQQRQIQTQVQQVQAARAAAHQASALAQAQSTSQDSLWMWKQRGAQLKVQYDAHYRALHELNRNAQQAQAAMNSSPAGSIDYERARVVFARTQSATKDHTMQMDRIQYALSSAHAHILQQQNVAAAAREQRQRQMLVQSPHRPPEPHGATSPHSMTTSETHSPKQSAGNGQMPVKPASIPVNHDVMRAALDVERREMEVGESPEDEQQNTKRNLTNSYDAVAASEGWEKVTRNAKETGKLEAEDVALSNRVLGMNVLKREAIGDDSSNGVGGMGQASNGTFEEQSGSRHCHVPTSEMALHEAVLDSISPSRSPRETVPTVAPWSKTTVSGLSNNGLSLREIQREELRSKAEERTTSVQQEREELPKGPTARWNINGQPWGGAGDVSKQPTLSLREIEEEQKKKKKTTHVTREATGSVNAQNVAVRPLGTKTGWASIAAKNSNLPARRPAPAAIVVGKKMDEETPFWDSVRAQPQGNPVRPVRAAFSRAVQGNNTHVQPVVPVRQAAPRPQVVPASRKSAAQVKQAPEVREVKTEESVVIGGRISQEFGMWCAENLQKVTGQKSPDTMLCEYLVTIPSAAEIKETILQNLGANDRTRSFADEFIRRLEFERTSIVADAGTGGSTGRKKGRRHRAAKVDASLVLGFTSTSSRIMQGTIETPEMNN